ncbi:MAG: ShlB/FhaC/HecB family hemolysin secretion/activation protein [Thermodesulfovibrionales bacterium]
MGNYCWSLLLLIALSLLQPGSIAAVQPGDLPPVKPPEAGPSPAVRADQASDSGGSPDDLILAHKVRVSGFALTGNTVLSPEELSAATSPYIGREISFEELQELRQKLTSLYVEKGYINSGVLIPDQKVRAGIVSLTAAEGRLTGMVVEGAKRLRPRYITGRLEPYLKEPLNVFELQEGLQLLQQNPRLQKINAVLSPGISAGEAELKVTVEEERPYRLWISAANDYSPSIGSYGSEFAFSHNNLTGFGDTLSATFGLTLENALIDGDLNYTVPLTGRDTLLSFHYRVNKTTVVEEPFKDLDIRSRNRTFGITLSHPFHRTAYQEFSMGVTGELRQSRTFLLGRSFSFTDGSGDGRSRETVLRFFQEWSSRSQQQVLALRSTFSFGVDAFQATLTETGPDAKFLTWLSQFQWIRRLGDKGIQALFRADMQLSRDPLLSIEKFSVGGMNSVRGYRKNALVRDNGIAASVELRFPLVRSEKRGDILQLIPFMDYGKSWNTRTPTPSPTDIGSAGVGFKWMATDAITVQAYLGIPLKQVPVSEKDLQDRGLHFKISARLL